MINMDATKDTEDTKKSNTTTILRCNDVMSLVEDQFAILSGGRDSRGGAIITFPSTNRCRRTDKVVSPDDCRLLLRYLMSIPSNEVISLGFTTIIDMRGDAWIYMDMHGYAWICVATHGYAWICLDMRGYAWIRTDTHGYA